MSTTKQDLPRGGMWEKQVVYGGERMRETFGLGELFILWGIASGGEVAVEQRGERRMVAKTVLEVSRMGSPEEHFEVGTLSSAIADMVPDATPSDFPVVAFWREVDPKEPGLNPATVLEAKEPYSAS